MDGDLLCFRIVPVFGLDARLVKPVAAQNVAQIGNGLLDARGGVQRAELKARGIHHHSRAGRRRNLLDCHPAHEVVAARQEAKKDAAGGALAHRRGCRHNGRWHTDARSPPGPAPVAAAGRSSPAGFLPGIPGCKAAVAARTRWPGPAFLRSPRAPPRPLSRAGRAREPSSSQAGSRMSILAGPSLVARRPTIEPGFPGFAP